MFDYLQKFNKLPKNIKDKASSPFVIKKIEELEERYGVDLAAFVMKYLVKDIDDRVMSGHLAEEFSLDGEKALKLSEELKTKVLSVIEKNEKVPKIFKEPLSPEKEEKSLPKAPNIFVNKIKQEIKKEEEKKPIFRKEDKKEVQKKKESVFKKEETEKKIENVSISNEVIEKNKNKGAGFFFSPDDEEEIRELTKKIDLDFSGDERKKEIDKKIELIIKKAEIDFGSSELLNRFKDIIFTYLKGIRDEIDVKQSLMKPFGGGGLSFDLESAGKIILIAKQVKDDKDSNVIKNKDIKKPEEKINNKINKEEKEIKRDVEYDLKKSIEEINRKKAKDAKETKNYEKDESESLRNTEENEDTPPLSGTGQAPPYTGTGQAPPYTGTRQAPPHIVKGQAEDTKNMNNNKAYANKESVENKKDKDESLKTSDNVKEKKKTERLAPPPPVIRKNEELIKVNKDDKRKAIKKAKIKSSERIFRQRINEGGKTRMDDVKYVPKVMSPIDELKYMDLVSFRRIDSDPEKAISKILNRFSLLEEDSYAKRLEGIRAWRISPVNKLYLIIGNESITTGKRVDEIIENRKKDKKDYLTKEEFKAVLNLNKKIRF
jgi:hypothetical protein